MDELAVAKRAFARHVALHGLADYRGILSLQAYAHLGLLTGDAEILDACRTHLLPFVRGEVAVPTANFKNYLCGGNGTALLFWQGHLPEAEDAVRRYAGELMHAAPRGERGIFCHPRFPGEGRIWIDVAFAVTPFLLFAGLALGENAYIEEAVRQTTQMVDVFRDPANGLLHQCKHFRGADLLSQDHWSRGNGWCLLALAELVHWLPADDPRRSAAVRRFLDLVQACLTVQDADGMWHQELTRPDAYVETSGTGLILYAIGVGLATGLLDDDAHAALERGLSGYRRYIGPDGAVFHTCRGCLCPGEGTVLDYMARAPLLDDSHAFGPVILAFGQGGALARESDKARRP